MSPRILVCESCLEPADPALRRLVDDGFELVRCRTCEELLELAIAQRPAAVVCQFDASGSHDLGMLKLLRRIHPGLPIVLLSTEGSLEIQRRLLTLRPTYFAVLPVEESELSEAVRGARVAGARG